MGMVRVGYIKFSVLNEGEASLLALRLYVGWSNFHCAGGLSCQLVAAQLVQDIQVRL